MGSKIKLGAGLVALGVLIGAPVWYRSSSRPVALFWEPDARQSYALHSQTLIQGHVATAGEVGPLQNDSYELDGTLNLRVLAVETSLVRVGFQLTNVEVRQNRRRVSESESLYAQLFYVTFSPDGQIVDVDFPNTIAAEDQQTVANTLRSLEVVLRSNAGRSWTAAQSDRLGSYEAAYTVSGAVTRSKRSYSEILDKTGRIDVHRAVEIKESTLKCTFGAPVTWLDACNGNELIAVTTENGALSKISTRISLTRQEADLHSGIALWRDSLDSRADVEQWKRGPIEPSSIARKKEIEALSSLVGDAGLAQYVDELFAACTAFSGTCVSRIDAYLRLNPEAALEVPDYLLKSGLTDDQRAMLVNALQNDKSVYAQQALLRMVTGDEFPQGNRVQSVVALGDVPRPAPGVIDKLWDIYGKQYRGHDVDQKLSDNAMLSLGRIARSLSQDHTEAERQNARDITARLQLELSREHDPGRLSSVMYAAANSGDETFVEPLSEYLRSSNTTRNRAAAAQALGIYANPTIDLSYADQLGTETDAGVRNAIVRAMTDRPASNAAVASVCAKIQTEENDVVRGEMYRFMMKNRKAPEVRQTLEQMSAVETSMENRRLISTALASHK